MKIVIDKGKGASKENIKILTKGFLENQDEIT